MAARIQADRAIRPAGWRTLEAGLILVDCLTLLASNVPIPLSQSSQEAEYETALMVDIDDLLEANQRLAQAADVVLFMVAGIPMRVKG